MKHFYWANVVFIKHADDVKHDIFGGINCGIDLAYNGMVIMKKE